MGIGKEQGAAPIFEGEILLCEDNEINQHFIMNQLTRLGLSVVIAGNGREGVDVVQGRINSGAKPFDLILMDIQMPVMDGLEAAVAITQLGVKTPIVALTSNVTPEDQAVYLKNCMPRALCKPFAVEELWECLGEYFTPVGKEEASRNNRQEEDEKQRIKLLSSFVRRNQTTDQDICKALEDGDVKLAHRLAHTLRGLAGLMAEKELMEAARVVEHALAGGDAGALGAEALKTMEYELKAVLEKLKPYLEDPKPAVSVSDWDREAARTLFNELEPLLMGDSAASQKYVDALRRIPETGALITQMEDYEFEAALAALTALRKKLEL